MFSSPFKADCQQRSKGANNDSHELGIVVDLGVSDQFTPWFTGVQVDWLC